MSEGSVTTTSSRIKQFGLYRTIDARTEEFLRLSRKRQIKQGCACAAVSTVVTVTIVIGVILIFEYGIGTQFPPNSITKPNWFGLMNTSEAIPFEAKFNKESINLDSSIHLLPLILKALNKNIYYDKIVEEDSSANPLLDKKEATENFNNNIYSGNRNWMGIPGIYAIEYKTSPVVFYKSPTRNTDYFTKIRRTKDYQRVMNYVNKMINERITAASTMTILKNSYNFNKNFALRYTTPTTDNTRFEKKRNFQKKSKNAINTKKRKCKCNCSKKMNELLSKVMIILQKLLPNSTHDMLRMPKLCEQNPKSSKKHVTEKSVHATMVNQFKEYNNTKNKMKSLSEKKKPYKMISQSLPNKEAEFLIKSLPPKVDYTLNTIIKLIKPNNFIDKKMMSINFNKHKFHRKQPMNITEDYYFTSDDTTKYIPILEKSINEIDQTISRDLLSTSSDSIVTTNFQPTSPTPTKKEDRVYTVASTTPSVITTFPYFDIHTLELVKSKLIPNKIKTKNKTENFDNNLGATKVYDDIKDYKRNNNTNRRLLTLRKMGQIIKTDLEAETNFGDSFENNYSSLRKVGPMARLESKTGKKFKDYVDNNYGSLRKFGHMKMSEFRGDLKTKNNYDVTRKSIYQYMNSLFPAKSISSYSSKINSITPPRHSTKENSISAFKDPPQYETLVEEEENYSYDDSSTLSNLKNLEKMINLLNNSITQEKTIADNISELYHFRDINSGNIKTFEEGNAELHFPKSRTSYLEMRRNNWKNEEHEDYDNNFNNYIVE